MAIDSHTCHALIFFYLSWNVKTLFSFWSPTLTWRDMQHIVVNTARKANLDPRVWTTNGVGRQGNHRHKPVVDICFIKWNSCVPLLVLFVTVMDDQWLFLSQRGITLSNIGCWFFSVSHSFGFGLMDAGAMVRLARNWTSVPPQHICEIAGSQERNK